MELHLIISLEIVVRFSNIGLFKDCAVYCIINLNRKCLILCVLFRTSKVTYETFEMLCPFRSSVIVVSPSNNGFRFVHRLSQQRLLIFCPLCLRSNLEHVPVHLQYFAVSTMSPTLPQMKSCIRTY